MAGFRPDLLVYPGDSIGADHRKFGSLLRWVLTWLVSHRRENPEQSLAFYQKSTTAETALA